MTSLRVVVAVAGLSLLGGCSSKAPPQKLEAGAASYKPFQIATFTLADGEKDLADGRFEGTLGTASVVFSRVDARGVVGLIPEVSPGQYTLSLAGAGTLAEATVRIDPAVAVPDPVATLNDVHSGLDAGLGELAASTADPATAASANALRDAFSAELARIAAAGGDELRRTAALFAANPALAGMTGAAPTVERPLFGINGAVCGGVAGEKAIDCIEAFAVLRIGVMLVSAIELATLPGGQVLAALAVAAQLVSMNHWLLNELQQGLVQFGKMVLTGNASGPVRSRAAPAAATVDGTTYVPNGEFVHFGISSGYRSVQTEDATSGQPVLGALAAGLEKFAVAWELTKKIVKDDLTATPVSFASIPYKVQNRPVPGSNVAVSVGTLPADTTIDASIAGDELVIAVLVGRPELLDAPFDVTLRYQNAGVAASTTTLHVAATCSDPAIAGTWLERCSKNGTLVLERGVEFAAGGPYAVDYECSVSNGKYSCRESCYESGGVLYCSDTTGSGEWATTMCNPLRADVHAQFQFETSPYAEDVWYDYDKAAGTMTTSHYEGDCTVTRHAASSTVPWP